MPALSVSFRLRVSPKRHIAAVAKRLLSKSGSSSVSVPVSLPPELWGHIGEFLSLQDISRLCTVNHAFYDAFIHLIYRDIQLHLPSYISKRTAEQALAQLVALQSPEIGRKVRSLTIDSYLVEALIWQFSSWNSPAPFPASATSWSVPVFYPDGCVSRDTFEQAIQSSLSSACHLTHLTLHSRHPAFSRTAFDSVIPATLWTACSQTLVHLELTWYCRPRIFGHTFRAGCTFPRLRSLSATSPVYCELLKDLRSLIPNDGGVIEDLSIDLHEEDPSPLKTTSFGSLKKLHLDSHVWAMPSIQPFIFPHRATLQEITLGSFPSVDLRQLLLLDPNILTSLSLYADPPLENLEELFPFLFRCVSLHTLKLLHSCHVGKQCSRSRISVFAKLLRSLPPSLTVLTFPGIIMDSELFLFIFHSLPNLSSLTLYNCYPANEEIWSVWFSPAEMGEPVPPQHRRIPWMLEFEGVNAQPLRRLALEDPSTKKNKKAFSKLFAEALTRSFRCCGTIFELE